MLIGITAKHPKGVDSAEEEATSTEVVTETVVEGDYPSFPLTLLYIHRHYYPLPTSLDSIFSFLFPSGAQYLT